MLKEETKLSIRNQMLQLLLDRQAKRELEAESHQESQVTKTSPSFPYKSDHLKSVAHIQKRRIVLENLASAVLQVEARIVLSVAARRLPGPATLMEAV